MITTISALCCRKMFLASQNVMFNFRMTFWITLLNTRNHSFCQNCNPFNCWMMQKLLCGLLLRLSEVSCLCHRDCLRNVLTRHRLLNISTIAVYPDWNNGICTNVKQPSCHLRVSCNHFLPCDTVLAWMLSVDLCVSVYHMPLLYRNGCTYQADFWHTGFP